MVNSILAENTYHHLPGSNNDTLRKLSPDRYAVYDSPYGGLLRAVTGCVHVIAVTGGAPLSLCPLLPKDADGGFECHNFPVPSDAPGLKETTKAVQNFFPVHLSHALPRPLCPRNLFQSVLGLDEGFLNLSRHFNASGYFANSHAG